MKNIAVDILFRPEVDFFFTFPKSQAVLTTLPSCLSELEKTYTYVIEKTFRGFVLCACPGVTTLLHHEVVVTLRQEVCNWQVFRKKINKTRCYHPSALTALEITQPWAWCLSNATTRLVPLALSDYTAKHCNLVNEQQQKFSVSVVLIEEEYGISSYM